MAKAAPKKVTKAEKAEKAETTTTAAAATAVADAPSTVHGVTLSFGHIKDGGTAKKPVVAVIPRKSIQVIKGFNPRTRMEGVEDLAASIKKDGLLSALTVRPSADEGKFDLVCGERRLKALDVLGFDEIPVLIRTDLSGDDERAKAAAVAENSEDSRYNLNAIEMGRVFEELSKKSWTVARIAAECNVNHQKVRRCLTLMEAPEDVRKKLEKGEVSMGAAIEYAKLDEATRSKIKSELNNETSANDIRALAKQVAKSDETVSSSAPDGKGANKKTGTSRDASLATWKGSKAKQSTLAELCHTLHNAATEDVGTPDYHEIRGSIGVLLWDRGDIDSCILPTLNSSDAKDQKAAKKFASLVAAEAKKFKVPESEQAAAAGAEEAAAD